MKRLIPLLVCALLLQFSLPRLQAQEQAVGILSIKSGERVLNGIGSVGRWLTLNGTAAEQQEAEQAFRSMIEPFMSSLDPQLPAGAAIWLSPEGMPDPLVFLPIKDATTLLNSIAPFVGQPQPAGDAQKFALPGMPPVFVQTKGDWTFVAMNQQRIATAPADPAKLLGPLPRLFDISVRLKVQAVPAQLRNQLVDMAAQSLPGLVGPRGGGGFPGPDGQPPAGPAPGDPAMQAAMKQQVETLRRFLNETDQLVLGISLDDAKQELRFDFVQKAVAGTSTAEVFNGWKTKRPTEFAGFYRPDAGLHAHVNMQLAAASVTSWTQQLDQSAKMLSESAGDGGAGGPPAEVITTLIDVLKAFISNGDSDLVVSLSSANGPSLLVAGKVAEVASVEKAKVMAAVALADVPGVTMRQETVSNVPFSFWSLPLPDSPDVEPLKQVLGPTIELAVGISQNKAYLALGPPGVMAKLKTALNGSKSPLVRSPVPSMLLFDLKKLIGDLNLTDVPDLGEWAAQLGKIQAPMTIRMSTIPSTNSGTYRLQIGSGALFALTPRPVADSGADDTSADPFGSKDPFDDAPSR